MTRDRMRNKPFPIIEPQFIVGLLHVLTTMGGCCPNRCFLPPGLSFLPAVWVPRSNQLFIKLANRFSQCFAKYLHHCTSFYRQLLPPGLFMARVPRTIRRAPFKMCAQYTRARSPAARSTWEVTTWLPESFCPDKRHLMAGRTGGHSWSWEPKFLILFVLCILSWCEELHKLNHEQIENLIEIINRPGLSIPNCTYASNGVATGRALSAKALWTIGHSQWAHWGRGMRHQPWSPSHTQPLSYSVHTEC